MPTAWGNQVWTSSGNWWRVGIRVTETGSDNEKVYVKVEGLVETYWGFNVYANGSIGATNADTRSWSGSLNQGAYGVGATTVFASYDDWYGRWTSTRTINFWAKYNVTGGYGNGTSNASTTMSVSPKPSYTVSYDANGGSGAPGNQTKWYNESLTLSSTKPTRNGHIFKGWATSSGGSVAYAPGATYTGNGALTLYAVWQAVTYTVSYNANGGSGAPGNQTKTWGVNLTLSSTKPTRANYNFKGWGTSASSTTVAYAPGATYSNNGAITLYAIWKLAWVAPRITNLDATRCDSAGNFTDEGTYAKVSFSWATDRTISSIKIVCNSVTYTPSGTGTSGNVSMVIGNGGLSTESSYTVTITVADSVGNSSLTTTISPMHFIMDFAPNGSVSFGEPADDSTPKFQISKNLPAYIKSSIRGFHGEGNFSSVKYKVLAKGQYTFDSDYCRGHARIFGSIGGMTQSSCGPIDIYVPFRENSANNLLVTVTELSAKAVSGKDNAKIIVRLGNDNVVYIILACHTYYTYNLMIEGIQIDIVDSDWSNSIPVSGTDKFDSGNPKDRNIDGLPLKGKYVNGYYGISCPSFTGDNSWVRTPSSGLIPYSSNSSSGASSLGTPTWPFNSAYAVGLNIWNIYFRKMPGGNIFKELWSGNWSSGSITVPNAHLYNVFAFLPGGNNPVLIGCRTQRNSGTIHAIGGGYWGSVWVNTLHINISGDTMKMYHSNTTPLNNSGNQTDGIAVSHIIGII